MSLIECLIYSSNLLDFFLFFAYNFSEISLFSSSSCIEFDQTKPLSRAHLFSSTLPLSYSTVTRLASKLYVHRPSHLYTKTLA